MQIAVPLKCSKPKIPSLELIEPEETATAPTLPDPIPVLHKDHAPIPVPPPLLTFSNQTEKIRGLSPPIRPVPAYPTVSCVERLEVNHSHASTHFTEEDLKLLKTVLYELNELNAERKRLFSSITDALSQLP